MALVGTDPGAKVSVTFSGEATGPASLIVVNHQTSTPRFLTNRAIWGWVRQEVAANLCLGTRIAVREKVGGFFTELAHRREEVKRRCRTILQARAAKLTGSARANTSGQANADFTLASD